MGYGGYVLIAVLVLASVFFILALYNRGNIKTLKFTSLGLATLILVGIISYYALPSEDLRIALIVLMVISLIFLWFFMGARKDETRK
mgnify:CR=1 FL=1